MNTANNSNNDNDNEDPWVSHVDSIQDITIDTVPDEYNRIYHDIKSKYEKIDISCLEQLLKASSLSTTIQQQILDIIHLNNHNNPLFVTRNAFHLFLSLVALAQSDIDISLVSIAKYKHNLPIPYFDPIDPPISPPSHSSILSPHDIQQQLLNQWLSSLDTILLSKVPEKEGNFLFKHVNYQLESEKLGTKVIRRFSDFWWLWEVLLRRYPFRLIPHLPPKRLTARSLEFEENRRRGLERFINAVVRHPVLGKDDIVHTFLSHASSLTEWRQQQPPIALDDEFIEHKQNIEELEKMVPIDWNDRVIRMKKRSIQYIKQYQQMLFIMHRIVKFKKALGTDYIRYSMALTNLAEFDKDCTFSHCQGCPQLAKSQSSIAKSMQQAGMSLNREAVEMEDLVIEHLIRQKDLFESFKELIERKESMPFVSNNILAQQMAKHKRLADHGLSLVKQREIYIKYCIMTELSYLHKMQTNVSTMYNNYVKHELAHSSQWTDHWKGLMPSIEQMPNTPDDFM
ncbi:hypothetical protein G6F70_008558 [Rhizopus microsporus]|nr:hypothetical protein G6F71_008548 [Rhizopus microsporus]KAG1195011.1 hypothetical protein G6F70_008558 [Rhizopus microsporus]KAG1206848.1 hypothetical protein G6F69_008518 [Rhizopus microsporus]KAG1227396.1 hypothetical protein G6F67_008476 [Rhizopus microsporus]KAG1259199.1 hypothetical protein G6F68_008279 [Rhizopus microsporus]